MRRFDLIIISFVTAILIAGLAAISWQTIRTAQTLLLPALDQKADTVARSLSSLVSEAVGYGIALEDLVRAEEVLVTTLNDNPEFGYAAIVDEEGGPIAFAKGDDVAMPEGSLLDGGTDMRVIAAPVTVDGIEAGEVVVGIPNAVAETLVRELWVDVAVLLVVAILVALELVAFAFSVSSAVLMRGLAQRFDALSKGDFRPHTPLQGTGRIAEEVQAVDAEIDRVRQTHASLTAQAEAQGAQEASASLKALGERNQLGATRHDPPVSLVAVRAPVFLFFFAEELTRPFLPTFIEGLAEPVAGLSKEMVIAFPIILFMAIVAFSQPVLNTWTERFGRARSLRVGALVAMVGFMGTALSSSMVELIVFRSITAIGFGTVFVSAQGYIVDRTGARNRARGIGLFVSAIMAAMLCGPPIGGIVADRLGVNAAFVLSAVMALIAYVCAFVALRHDTPTGQSKARAVRFSDIVTVLRQPLLMLLLVGCALPSKMILIGVCFYYLPLAMTAEAFEPAAIGRVLMLYGLAMLIIVPAISRLSDERSRRTVYVVLGGVLSGAAVLHLFIWPAPWGAALMVLQIGIAQGISTTPQSALVGELGRRHLPHLSEGGLYGVFRLIERTGTALGPAVVAAIWGATDGPTAVLAMGGLVVLGALVFGLSAIGSTGKAVPAATTQ